MEENSILLRGQALERPAFSHESHGKRFDLLPLRVARLSGAWDTLNLLLPAELSAGVEPGEFYEIEGEVRSFNNRSGLGSRLVITVYVRALRPCDEKGENLLSLTGTLCKQPIHRYTPLGREISDLMLAVPRRYGRSDYLPCIAWGSLAHRCAEKTTGDRMGLSGRLQSREYQKRVQDQTLERTAFEVSVMSLAGDAEGEEPYLAFMASL